MTPIHIRNVRCVRKCCGVEPTRVSSSVSGTENGGCGLWVAYGEGGLRKRHASPSPLHPYDLPQNQQRYQGLGHRWLIGVTSVISLGLRRGAYLDGVLARNPTDPPSLLTHTAYERDEEERGGHGRRVQQ